MFLSAIFLWALLSISIPILIALWNRRQTRREDFGGYYLLRRLLQSTHKRIRLWEILKLLNRIALLCILILLFAEPQKKQIRLSGADDGFALILDVGRSMQSLGAHGNSLASEQIERVHSILAQIPSRAQGVIFFVSDRCDSFKLSEGRLTASSEQWLEQIRLESIPYANAPTTTQAFTSCINRMESLFDQKEILSIFISPLPSTLDLSALKMTRLKIERLDSPESVESSKVEIRQELMSDKVRLILNSNAPGDVRLIRRDRVENLGQVLGSLDLPAANDTWVWYHQKVDQDPWLRSSLLAVQKQESYQVTVWSMKESPGYLSLISALRNFPEMKIIKSIGGEPQGDSLIIYGSYPFSTQNLKRAWFFLDPSAQQPFEVRDHKQWSVGSSSADLSRSFHIQTRDGEIFVKKYSLYQLDRFDILETFQDGAPSLLSDKKSDGKIWLSTFDLEDLTTDLTLESTFIPYLYRHLESWLAVEDPARDLSESTPIWLMPGTTKPMETVAKSHRWPGIYGSQGRFRVVDPVPYPESFLKWEAGSSLTGTREDLVSLRPALFKALVASIFIELILCLISFRVLAVGIFILCLPFSAEAGLRSIPISYFRGIDPDRKIALEQFVVESARLTNLDFAKPIEANLDRLWESSFVLVSSARPFGPLSKDEREKIREYCERGGLLIFDDPLATAESTFYQSVKAELQAIFPSRPLKAIPKEDVLFRTFYILNEVSGRKLASPYLEGVELDRRWVAVFSFNDLLGANLKSNSGDFAFSVSPYGIEQRTLARRLFVNFEMYSVTMDYKDDAIHLPYILKKRVR